MTLTKEAKVGLLALVAGIMLYVGFNFLKGSNFFSPTNKYYAIYDNVEGLATSNKVMLNGVGVGRVSFIKLLPERNNLILITMEMSSDLVLGDSTKALLVSDGLLGGKSIELKLAKNTRIFESGDTLIGAKPQGFTELLSAKAMPIMANLDSTVYKLNNLFGDELGLSIKNTLHNFELASHDLRLIIAHSKNDLGAITNNLNALSSSLKETEREIRPLMNKMNRFADSLNDMQLKKTVASANLALKNLNDITAKINDGSGTLGLLINDKGFYQKLDNSAKDLDLLLIDVKKNPKRYVHFSVFGRKDKEPKAAASTP